ncbi:MAG: hypothetical protein EXX96DRAFT_572368 [Benjaminiella poitrasii]|nr:MAG: hypothetical protein EXX96DRAFT_572368 [Benjaminiella poitrasii]
MEEQIKLVLELHWNLVINIAISNIESIEQFNVHDPDATIIRRTRQASSSNGTSSSQSQQQSGTTVNRAILSRETIYERESHITRGLDVLFSIVHKSSGYLTFISSMMTTLDQDNPIAVAFLNHIIDRATLPSQKTLGYVSPLILMKLTKKPSRIQRMISLISGRYKLERSLSKRIALRKQIFNIAPKPSLSFMIAVQNEEQTKLKLNAALLWCYLADKFAGEMCTRIWSREVSDVLFNAVYDVQEDLMVRIFSLLAIEKFARTRCIKDVITKHSLDIRTLLLDIVRECELANERIYLISSNNMDESILGQDSISKSMTGASDTTFDIYKPVTFSTLNIFTTKFVPPKGPLRDEWGKYAQLNICARWALDHRFKNEEKIVCPWDLSNLRIIMNPFDATPEMKMSCNGLELRNDRPYFESIRATACVRTKKWYYETLLLSNGIMQIGWATNRCKFVPEEGAGVGDDNNGFAFDTFRSGVWANGTAVYPQGKVRIRCRIGDVIGSYLDLDNGLCRYFVNGRDLGLTVEFEKPFYKLERRKSLELPDRPTIDEITSPVPEASTFEPRRISTKNLYYLRKELLRKQNATRGVGLYPAISLTANQHVLVNFGDSPWMFPPPIKSQFQGVNKAGYLDPKFKKLVMHWVQKRGLINEGKLCPSLNRQPYRPLYGTDPTPQGLPSVDSNSSCDELSDADSDKGLGEGFECNICFSEPQNIMLLPCKHDGICLQCAKILITCHLCRTKITDRVKAK